MVDKLQEFEITNTENITGGATATEYIILL
ncbi:hypothetical protein C8N46_11199 [Kordia periserrulae]|uniref:Uncharacterized protein n=1 Tax=Kordia periserrulae TaxID=701523 RepID=A0A2T6BSH3_9FLAO|nr:hypothetical protein C8N46_11199 [Kordia periserrulae]